MWIDVNEKLPDYKELVLTKCPGMGPNNETMIIPAKIRFDEEWYAGYPYNQPIEPTHWRYSMVLND